MASARVDRPRHLTQDRPPRTSVRARGCAHVAPLTLTDATHRAEGAKRSVSPRATPARTERRPTDRPRLRKKRVKAGFQSAPPPSLLLLALRRRFLDLDELVKREVVRGNTCAAHTHARARSADPGNGSASGHTQPVGCRACSYRPVRRTQRPHHSGTYTHQAPRVGR